MSEKGTPRSAELASLEEAAFARMAPVISHEIRNPLAVIGNSSYYVKAKLAALKIEDPKIQKHFSIIDAEIRRANGTLGEILSFCRMREPAKQACSLNALVEDTLREFPLPEKVALRRRFDKAEPTAPLDSELARKALAHVLRNAAEAALDPAARECAVSIFTGKENGAAFVEVADGGPGFPKEALERLFLPFFTTKPRGIGLGLAYAHKAMSRHGGEILVSEGPGAKVRLAFKA